MPVLWETLTFAERAAFLLECTDLHEDDFQTVYDEWAGRIYPDDAHREERALADLMRIANRHVFARHGKTEAENARVAAFVAANKDKVTLE